VAGAGDGGGDDGMFDAGCRLQTLERTLCGFEREGDVPGFEIPDRYFRYVRTGDARPLAGVLEHNRLDLLSLALVTARAAQLVDEGRPACAPRAKPWAGTDVSARGTARRRATLLRLACGLDASCAQRAAAGRRRRRGAARRGAVLVCPPVATARFFDDAAAAWSCLLTVPGCPPAILREAPRRSPCTTSTAGAIR
jgi:hypothetical protein